MGADQAVGTGTGISWGGTDIAKLYDIKLPESSVPTIDLSTYDTPRYKEFISGDLVDNGEISLTAHLNTGAGLQLGKKQVMVITFADDDTWTFDAILSKTGGQTPLEDLVKVDLTFKVSGEIAGWNVTPA